MKVSGDVEEMDKYFRGEKVTMWEYLEDLALIKPTESPEYAFLL